MSHLPIERLAALADEQPNADEQAHLAACAECTRELDAIRSLVTLAGAERTSMSMPLSRWEKLSPKLRDEGLMLEPGMRGVTGEFPVRRTRRTVMLLQAAAALLLFVGGVAAGRAFEGGQSSSASASPDAMVPTAFASTTDAARWQSALQSGYQRATEYLASHDSSAYSPAAMRTRLSVLDRTVRAVNEGLKDAPYDPVLSDLAVNSWAQREAALRVLNTALPQGARLNSF